MTATAISAVVAISTPAPLLVAVVDMAVVRFS